MSAGRLIVLEGVDGSGTTTQARLLGQALTRLGRQAVLTAEPTAGPVGALLRRALTHALRDAADQPVELDFAALALLFAADRLDHNTRVLRPALAAGKSVISDRYTLSSLLYQSLTAPQDRDWLPWLRQINAQALVPDLVLVLDVPAKTASERRQSRGGAAELFERESLQRRLCEAYASAESAWPGVNIRHLDGARPAAQVAGEILENVLEVLGAPQQDDRP
jgi:dTMP kinase